MAGPTFGFWYTDFSAAMCTRLGSILREVAEVVQIHDGGSRGRQRTSKLFDAELYVASKRLRGRRYDEAMTGTIGIYVDRHREDYHPKFVRDALVRELGAVPSFELGGYCMAKQDNDWDALRLLAERITAAFGGWVLEQGQGLALPSVMDESAFLDGRVREIVARDPQRWREERYWLLDARMNASQWVRK